MKFCKECGQKLPDQANYCNACGSEYTKSLLYTLPEQYNDIDPMFLGVSILTKMVSFQLEIASLNFDVFSDLGEMAEHTSMLLEHIFEGKELRETSFDINNRLNNLLKIKKNLFKIINDNKYIFIAGNYYLQQNDYNPINIDIFDSVELEYGEFIAELKNSENYEDIITNYLERLANYFEKIDAIIEEFSDKINEIDDQEEIND